MSTLLQFGSLCGLILAFGWVYNWLGKPRKKVVSDQDVTGKIPVLTPVEKKSFFARKKLIGAVLIIIAAALFIYKDKLPIVGTHFTKAKISRTAASADPCSQCRPDEKTIGVEDVLDDGRITWKWSGPCTGGGVCGQCQVKQGSCTTENDTDFALKCACVKQ